MVEVQTINNLVVVSFRMIFRFCRSLFESDQNIIQKVTPDFNVAGIFIFSQIGLIVFYNRKCQGDSIA